jgi:ABC-type transport system substrate-binding protein
MKKTLTYMLMAIMITSSVMSVKLASAAQIAVPFTVITGDTPSKIDPADAYDSVSIDAIAQVFEGLYRYNLSEGAGMAAIPCIASAMGTWTENNTVLTIPLRDDVTFHDGTPLTADDVKWNFDRIFAFAAEEISTPAVLYLNDDGDTVVEETVVVDDYTIKFVLNKAWAVWEQLLAFSGSFILKPNDKYEDAFLTVNDVKDAIGTGPFKLTKIVPDEKTTFKRYDDYRLGAANITDILYRVIADGDAASLAMLAHEAHYGGVGADYLEDARNDEAITITHIKTSVVFYLQMNINKIPYDARRAISFAFNYTYYLEQTLANQSFALHTPVPDGMNYHNPDIEGLPYLNLTIARQMLLDSTDADIMAGIAANSLSVADIDNDTKWINAAMGDDPIFSYNFTRYESTGLTKFAAVLVDSMKKIGVLVTDFVIGDWGTWTDWVTVDTNKAKLELSFGGWGPDYNDPINMMEPIYKTNASYNDCNVADAPKGSVSKRGREP